MCQFETLIKKVFFILSTKWDFDDELTDEAERENADTLLAFITPIAKAFLTELGFESANHALQIYGGHGYIQEWGM